MSDTIDPQAVSRAVASLNELAGRYGRAYAQLGAGAVQELHVLRLSYDALGVVLGVRTPNERTDEEEQARAEAGYERHVLGIPAACDCEEQVELIYDNCESGVHKS